MESGNQEEVSTESSDAKEMWGTGGPVQDAWKLCFMPLRTKCWAQSQRGYPSRKAGVCCLSLSCLNLSCLSNFLSCYVFSVPGCLLFKGSASCLHSPQGPAVWSLLRVLKFCLQNWLIDYLIEKKPNTLSATQEQQPGVTISAGCCKAGVHVKFTQLFGLKKKNDDFCSEETVRNLCPTCSCHCGSHLQRNVLQMFTGMEGKT